MDDAHPAGRLAENPQEAKSPSERAPLVALTPGKRNAISLLAIGVAVVHVVFPDLAIDAVFLGLIAFAFFIQLFDIDAVEWQGIRARRRQIEREAVQIKALPVQGEQLPPTPPPPAPTGEKREAVVHRAPHDLMPPTDKAERLFWVAEQIRIELVILAGNTGRLPRRGGFDSYQAVPLAQSLAQNGVIPPELVNAIRIVVDQRNALAHGPYGWRVIGDAAGDLGIEILLKLRSTKYEYIRVIASPVDLYADRSLSAPIPVNGVMLEQIGHQGQRVHLAVYPTGEAYTPGRFVTWEWDSEAGIDVEAWYLDQNMSKPMLAFATSAFFAGREYPDQWGIEYRLPGPMIL